MTDFRKDRIEGIIWDLKGTTQDLEVVAARHGIKKFTTEDLYLIGCEVFRCDDCGKWYANVEKNPIDGFEFCDDCLDGGIDLHDDADI